MTLRNHPFPLPQCHVNKPDTCTGAVSDGKAELIRYSSWNYPETDIRQVGDCCEIRSLIPMLEKQSVVVEVGEDILVLSGLRWETRPGATDSRLVPFRRIIQLPGVVNDQGCQAAYEDGILVLTLFVVEQPGSG